MQHELPAMTIGALATAAGVGVETVRFYQSRGLMGVPRKPLQGIRRYGPGDLAQLQFIRRAQRLGFSLKEVADLRRLESQDASCADTRTLAQERLADVRQRLTDLADIEATLAQLVDACGDRDEPGACPIMAALSTDNAHPSRGRAQHGSTGANT